MTGYMEKYIEEPRHIEFQIVGDQFGHVVHLSERDCSIQRRHQKLSRRKVLAIYDPWTAWKMGEAAVKAGKAINHEGVGDHWVLVDKYRNFYFMEMNTRIQVGIPWRRRWLITTDQRTIKVGWNNSSLERIIIPICTAIEVRINAEDVYADFRPSPGKITSLHTAMQWRSCRYACLCGLCGSSILWFDDRLLICKADTRRVYYQAWTRHWRIYSGRDKNNIAFSYKQLMRNEDFRKGNFTQISE